MRRLLCALTLISGCDTKVYAAYDRDSDGFVAAELGGDDCDDTNAAVNPAQVEVCGNHLDDDCDGGPGPCVISGTSNLDAWVTHLVPDLRLKADATLVDLTGDGALDVVQHLGLRDIAVYAGPSSSLNGTPAATVRLPQAGAVWSANGDANGDHQADLLVGLGAESTVWVFFGPLQGALTVADADATLTALPGTAAGFGADVAFHPDVDGDGTDEVVARLGAELLLFHGPLSGAQDAAAADARAWVGGRELVQAAGAPLFVRGDSDQADRLIAFARSGAATTVRVSRDGDVAVAVSPASAAPGAPPRYLTEYPQDTTRSRRFHVINATSGAVTTAVTAEPRAGEAAVFWTPTSCDVDGDGTQDLIFPTAIWPDDLRSLDALFQGYVVLLGPQGTQANLANAQARVSVVGAEFAPRLRCWPQPRGPDALLTQGVDHLIVVQAMSL